MSETLNFSVDQDDLCDRLGGGIPKGSLVVLEGPIGAGKSILVQRIVYGLAKHGHSVSLVSTELTTAGFLQQMESLRYDVEDAIGDESLVFIPTHPMIGARAPREQLLRRILQARLMYAKEVVVFDTFSKFLSDHLRFHGDQAAGMSQVEAVLHLFKRLTSLGKTIILTLEEDQVADHVAGIFRETADMFLEIQFEVMGGSASRRILARRMSRAAGRFGEIIGFRVEPGVGIVIEIKSVV